MRSPDDGADDLDLLAAARAGDGDAGRRLLRRHGRSMVRTAWSVAGRWDGGDAKDVVQEALIAALTTPALPRGDVGAWLRAIIDERRGQLHEEAEATRERIRKILTPEQRDRFDEMGPPPPGPPGGPRPGDRRPVPRRPRPRRPQG